MFYRTAALAALTASFLFSQGAVPPGALPPSQDSPVADPVPEAKSVPDLQPDLADPMVVRALEDLQRVRILIGQGALPAMRLQRAQENLEDAKDLSLLRVNLYSKDLLPEQADQLVTVAQKMVIRRQRSMIQMRQLVESGIISRSEAEMTDADLARAQTELQLAQTRANLIQQIAESLKIEKGIASLELQVESHPDWAGKVYTKFDGRGVFTPADMQRISSAFLTRFGKSIPISADGETALHRSMGFDHRGRVDVAVSPDQPEGVWLMRLLETNRIPYFAFRMAVPGMATGAHIHIGPGSTRLGMSD